MNEHRKRVDSETRSISSMFSRVLTILLALAIGAGIVARVQSIAYPPLVEDEYYSATAVQFILEKGVPEFPTGGYYARSLPLLYLQAASVWAFGDTEWAHRLPALLFSILCLALVYLCARRFAPPLVALACVALMALSAWQIEFARFGRMYAPFQFVTLAFFLAYHRSFFGEKPGWPYLPHCLAVAAVLTHSLGVFLLPFLFLPLIPKRFASGMAYPPKKLLYLGVSLVTSILCLAWWKFESMLWNLGATRQLPDGFRLERPEMLNPIAAFSAIPLHWTVWALLAVCVGAAVILALRSPRSQASMNFDFMTPALVLMLIGAAFHLLAFSLCLAIILLARCDLPGAMRRDVRKTVLVAMTFVISCGWIAYAVLDRTWVEQTDVSRFARAFRLALFGMPDFYEPIFRPWFDAMPLLTLAFVAGALWYLISRARKPLSALLAHPLVIPLGVFAGIAIIDPLTNPFLKSTRYTFFIYPLLAIGLALAIYEAIGRAAVARWRAVLTACLIMALFISSGDFSFRYLSNVNSPDVVFRTGNFERYEAHWFWRRDDRSVAEFLKDQPPADGLIVSVDARTLSYYLDRSIPFTFYCPQEGEDAWRYEYMARSAGTAELWTGRPLLGNLEELRRHTSRMNTIYLVRRVQTEARDFDIAEAWPERLIAADPVFQTRDGRTEVIAIQLN